MSALENLKQKLARKIKQTASIVKKQEPISYNVDNVEIDQQNLGYNVQNYRENGNKQNLNEQQYIGEKYFQSNSIRNKEQVAFNTQSYHERKIIRDINKLQIPKKDIYFDVDQQFQDNDNDDDNIEGSMDEQRDLAPFGDEYKQQKNQPPAQTQQEKKQFLQKKKEQQQWLKPKIQPFVIHNLAENTNEQQIEKQIEIMLKQPQQILNCNQNNQQEQQNQKYKQLMLNTIKNKTKKKHRRPMDKPTPFQQLSQPYQKIKIFAAYLPKYEERRNKQLFGNNVDLGVRTLHQVVLQCYLQGIITKQLLISIQKVGVEKELQFIKKFAENKLDSYNFKSVKFTPLDYRRLCTMLICHNKQKYTMGERIYCVFKQITDFYEVVYQMTQDEYMRLCNSMKMTYKLEWWNSIASKEEDMFQAQNQNIDTSTIYKPQASPLFGADINDPEKNFFQSKKKLYPDKYIEPKPKKGGSSVAGNNSEFSGTDRNNAFSSKNEEYSSIPEDSDESSSLGSKKKSESISEKPQFNDSQDMSDISSFRRSKRNRKNSMSESNRYRDQFSSVNSSRFDASDGSDMNQNESISDSLNNGESGGDSSALESLSMSSMGQRKKKRQRKGRQKSIRGKKKQRVGAKKRAVQDSDIDDSGNNRKDVFLQSSDQQKQPKKKKKS